MLNKSVSGILLDIEGTTSSISFVYDVMFPYVRENLRTFLQTSWDAPEFQACLPLLAQDVSLTVGQDSDLENGLADKNDTEKIDCVEQAVLNLMDADVKATGLKQLQGMIWKTGFQSGQLVAHLFDDVAPAIRNWHTAGLDVRIYSSGSIASQKLFFGHTVAGNLLDLLNGHYDTTTGPKQEPASYVTIGTDFDCPPEQIVFVSDIPTELAAAQMAGMQPVLSLRPGNKPVANNSQFRSIRSFSELVLDPV